MQRLLRSAIMLGLFAGLPLLGLAQDAKTKGKKTAAAPVREAPKVNEAAVRAKVLSGAFIPGKLTAAQVDEDKEDKTLTVTYVHQIKTLNTDVQKKVQQVLADASRTKDKAKISKLAEEYKALQAALYKIEEVPFAFECKLDKDVVVRQLTLPVQLGDDGKPKKTSAEEERKLKGDGKYPGYAASLKDLDPGEQLVRVYLDKTKIKPSTPAKTAEGAEAEKPVYPATLIVIVPPADDTKGGAVNPFFGK